jgi:hypothetical protein
VQDLGPRAAAITAAAAGFADDHAAFSRRHHHRIAAPAHSLADELGSVPFYEHSRIITGGNFLKSQRAGLHQFHTHFSENRR